MQLFRAILSVGLVLLAFSASAAEEEVVGLTQGTFSPDRSQVTIQFTSTGAKETYEFLNATPALNPLNGAQGKLGTHLACQTKDDVDMNPPIPHFECQLTLTLTGEGVQMKALPEHDPTVLFPIEDHCCDFSSVRWGPVNPPATRPLSGTLVIRNDLAKALYDEMKGTDKVITRGALSCKRIRVSAPTRGGTSFYRPLATYCYVSFDFNGALIAK